MEIIFRRGKFVWVYLNIGTYMHWKRIAFDFYVELFKKVRGFGFEYTVAEVGGKNQNCFEKDSRSSRLCLNGGGA
jgi:hypothetical protein